MPGCCKLLLLAARAVLIGSGDSSSSACIHPNQPTCLPSELCESMLLLLGCFFCSAVLACWLLHFVE
jgi:hypothetical protein